MSEKKNKLKIDFKASNGYSSKEAHKVSDQQFLDIINVLAENLTGWREIKAVDVSKDDDVSFDNMPAQNQVCVIWTKGHGILYNAIWDEGAFVIEDENGGSDYYFVIEHVTHWSPGMSKPNGVE